jgi:hypothetical protein
MADLPDYEHFPTPKRSQQSAEAYASAQTEEQPQQPQQPTMPQTINLPIGFLQNLAKSYVQYKPIINMAAKLGKFKIPKDFDLLITALGTDPNDANAVAQLQQLANEGKKPEFQAVTARDGQEVLIPSNRPGERVLTRDMMIRAYQLHFGESKLSYREIAAYFTDELSCPCSYGTIASAINEYIDELENQHSGRLRSLIKYFALSGALALAAYIGWLVH